MNKQLGNNQVVKILANEIVITKGAGKLLLIAAFFNIPFWGFIPYLTQAFTIILLGIFLKHVRLNKDKKQKELKQKNVSYTTTNIGMGLIVVTMIFQCFWFPFLSQLITLVALFLIYATMTKYKD